MSVYKYPTDVDECATNNGGCEHDCINTVGSFMCRCSRGYALESDGLNCRRMCVHYASAKSVCLFIIRLGVGQLLYFRRASFYE